MTSGSRFSFPNWSPSEPAGAVRPQAGTCASPAEGEALPGSGIRGRGLKCVSHWLPWGLGRSTRKSAGTPVFLGAAHHLLNSLLRVGDPRLLGAFLLVEIDQVSSSLGSGTPGETSGDPVQGQQEPHCGRCGGCRAASSGEGGRGDSSARDLQVEAGPRQEAALVAHT